MSDTCNAVVTMAVDTKKYGIRIHKALFRQLGEARYIQLLVNPDDGVVAIQTVGKGNVRRTDTPHRREAHAFGKLL